MFLAALPNSFLASSKRRSLLVNSRTHSSPPSQGTVMIKKAASTCSVLSFLLAPPLLAQSPSQWVYYDTNHHLQYQTDALGNKILDFSYAGYQGGGVALPNLPVRVTVQPSGG